MTSTRSYSSEFTCATYASRSSAKVDGTESSTSTLVTTRPNRLLGLTPYTAEFVEELITWRILQLYGPFMPAGYISIATCFFNKSSLHHVNAAQLLNTFSSKFRVEHNSVLKRPTRARCTFIKDAQQNKAIYKTISQVTAGAGLSTFTTDKALRLLSDYFNTTPSNSTISKSAPGPNATTMASAHKWDDLAKSILEDHGALSNPDNITAQVIRRRTQRLGISITRHLLPAIRLCKQTYFTRLHCRPAATTPERFELEYVEYKVAPQYQLNHKTGVHMIVQLKKAGLTKRTWKRGVRWVAVHPDEKRWSWSMTTRGSYGSLAPLRRVQARVERAEERGPEPEPERAFSHEESVDPLRQLRVGEEYATVYGRDGSGSMIE